jgi:poly(3-hydroxybutyrate) depolymerase
MRMRGDWLCAAHGMLLLAATLLALASRAAAQAQAPAPGPAPGVSCRASGELAAGTRLNVTLQSGGRERSFLLSLPADFKTAQPALLLALHGAGTKAEEFLDGGTRICRPTGRDQGSSADCRVPD